MFTALYTNLRYKLIPPSFTAKNRLFIERDSVKRRVINNVGLTFRNGKWANYERSNIHGVFSTYWKTLLGLIGVAFGLLFWTYHVSPFALLQTLPSWLSYGMWVTGDYIDYFSLLGVWLAFATWALVKRTFFMVIFNNVGIAAPSPLKETNYSTNLERQARLEEMRQTLKITKRFPNNLFQSWDVFSSAWVRRMQEQQYDFVHPLHPSLSLTLYSLFRLQHGLLPLMSATPIKLKNSTGAIWKPAVRENWHVVTPFIHNKHDEKRYGGQQQIISRQWVVPFLGIDALSPYSGPKLVRNSPSWDAHLKSALTLTRVPALGTWWAESLTWRSVDRWLKSYSTLHRKSLTHVARANQVKAGLSNTLLVAASNHSNLWQSEVFSRTPIEMLMRQLGGHESSFSHWDRRNLDLSSHSFVNTWGSISPASHTGALANLETSVYFALHRAFFFTSLSLNTRRVILDRRSIPSFRFNETKDALDMLHTLAPLLYSVEIEGGEREVTSSAALSLITKQKADVHPYMEFYGTSEHRDEPFFNSSNLNIILGLWQLRSLPVQFLHLPINVGSDELACSFDANKLDWDVLTAIKIK